MLTQKKISPGAPAIHKRQNLLTISQTSHIVLQTQLSLVINDKGLFS